MQSDIEIDIACQATMAAVWRQCKAPQTVLLQCQYMCYGNVVLLEHSRALQAVVIHWLTGTWQRRCHIYEDQQIDCFLLMSQEPMELIVMLYGLEASMLKQDTSHAVPRVGTGWPSQFGRCSWLVMAVPEL